MSYSIKTVATMTGIPKSTLIAWERRYDFVEPERSGNGYRVYSNEDVLTLKTIRALTEQGYKVSEAAELVKRDAPVERLHTSLADKTSDLPFADIRADLLDALVAIDRRRADQTTRRLLGVSFREQLEQVWFPLLREVGHGWADKRVTIVEEHFTTQYVREQLQGMLMSLQGGPPVGRPAVCVLFPGERHELGALGVAIRLALNGWRVTYLGGELPTEALCDYLQTHRTALLAVSLVYPQNQQRLAEFARDVRAAAPETRIVLGGSGLSEDAPMPPGVERCTDVDSLGSGR